MQFTECLPLKCVKTMKFIFTFIFSLGIILCFSQKVYKTPQGERYHLSTCNMVENVSEEITIQEALNRGLTPCKICKPPTVEGILQLAPNIARGQGVSVQCKGMTQRGTRCMHRTKLANGYCYQHNPDKKKIEISLKK
jgi:hypothetical protein